MRRTGLPRIARTVANDKNARPPVRKQLCNRAWLLVVPKSLINIGLQPLRFLDSISMSLEIEFSHSFSSPGENAVSNHRFLRVRCACGRFLWWPFWVCCNSINLRAYLALALDGFDHYVRERPMLSVDLDGANIQDNTVLQGRMTLARRFNGGKAYQSNKVPVKGTAEHHQRAIRFLPSPM
jgi:hypothetical protein